jgi:hypothetical protein
MKVFCSKCGNPLRRSNEISVHFHSHITEISRESGIPRNKVYWEVLILAVEIGQIDGGSPYPYVMVDVKIKSPISGKIIKIPAVHPHSTSMRNNKQMMTAVEASHIYAAKAGIKLTETCDKCKGNGILNGKSCEYCEGTGKEYI